MLLDVETFRKRTEYDLDSLVDDLSSATARRGAEERTAWRNSLPAFARVLSHESLRDLHVRRSADLIVEYRLPASPCWADIVMLGRGSDVPAAGGGCEHLRQVVERSFHELLAGPKRRLWSE
ncbi:MAG: hypothetical protein FJ253_11385 [Phycisphaerae bacterium]|nr:hypothetical protein [Phycisphaerae bacterium]